MTPRARTMIITLLQELLDVSAVTQVTPMQLVLWQTAARAILRLLTHGDDDA